MKSVAKVFVIGGAIITFAYFACAIVLSDWDY